MVSGLETGFLLDERWHRMTSGIERSKKPDLVLLARVLGEAKVAYAVIGGLALQVHQAEPRTTLDIDLAVRDRGALPRARLESAGFKETGRFAHSDNWIGPGGTPIQFTDDPALTPALERADEIEVEGVALRILRRADLLHAKLRAAADPARRRSKRLQDLADAQSLLEQDPALEAEIDEAGRLLLAGPLPL
jgi:hypothetical protein